MEELQLFVLLIHYTTLYQLISELSHFPTITERGRDKGNTYATIGDVYKRKETTHDSQLRTCLQ